MRPGRYHLVLAAAGRPAMHGWWDDETVARRKLASWIGDWGVSGSSITLTDEKAGERLTEWPEQA
ncbi:hypothetical protein [Streptomyces ziwulingensis]|uniref:Uncharacterized protein n=1 Tax=Streptomyces ziwulingensis TaxID=1045501 RepID=A0ABP9BUF8_9ACTN